MQLWGMAFPRGTLYWDSYFLNISLVNPFFQLPAITAAAEDLFSFPWAFAENISTNHAPTYWVLCFPTMPIFCLCHTFSPLHDFALLFAFFVLFLFLHCPFFPYLPGNNKTCSYFKTDCITTLQCLFWPLPPWSHKHYYSLFVILLLCRTDLYLSPQLRCKFLGLRIIFYTCFYP